MNHWSLFKRSFARMWHPTLVGVRLIAALSGGGFNFRFGSTQPLTDLPLGTRERWAIIIKSVNVAGRHRRRDHSGHCGFIFNTFSQGALISLIYQLEDNQSISVGKALTRRPAHPASADRCASCWLCDFDPRRYRKPDRFCRPFLDSFTSTQSSRQLFDISGLRTAIGLTA